VDAGSIPAISVEGGQMTLAGEFLEGVEEALIALKVDKDPKKAEKILLGLYAKRERVWLESNK
jgi:hypothetical protein